MLVEYISFPKMFNTSKVSISNQSSKEICMLNSLDYWKSFPNIEIWVASLTDVPLEKKKEGIGTR